MNERTYQGIMDDFYSNVLSNAAIAKKYNVTVDEVLSVWDDLCELEEMEDRKRDEREE